VSPFRNGFLRIEDIFLPVSDSFVVFFVCFGLEIGGFAIVFIDCGCSEEADFFWGVFLDVFESILLAEVVVDASVFPSVVFLFFGGEELIVFVDFGIGEVLDFVEWLSFFEATASAGTFFEGFAVFFAR